jgi:L-asparaginase / beta-aspartyl-peptidase
MPPYALAIHGGAGVISRHKMTPEREAESRAELRRALDAGEAILQAGGTALDAVTAAVVVLEDCPLFNAGRGAVFDRDGQHGFDASIMDGKNQQCGAVAAARSIKNPILTARKIMEETPHILLVGELADRFAAEQGLTIAPASYFFTSHRREQLRRAQESNRVVLDHGSDGATGTVGAVALDTHGNLASANSTGGMTNKLPGRAGDSALIGSGTWAQNTTCAVCTTGTGEAFIRTNAAARVAAMMEFTAATLAEATHRVVFQDLPPVQGSGGLIAVNRQGDISLPFNSGGMYRGYVKNDEEAKVAIWTEEGFEDYSLRQSWSLTTR